MVYTSKCPQNIEHSYYTFSVDYHSNKSKVKLEKILKEYVEEVGMVLWSCEHSISWCYWKKIGLSNMSKNIKWRKDYRKE